MANRQYSQEDLKELVAYIASNPAMLFPTLTKKEGERLVKDILDQYDEMQKADEGKKEDPAIVVKSSTQKGAYLPPGRRDVVLLISDLNNQK